MSGYTPVFDSVFHGTLCGQWPTLPVWLTILPLADKNGHIDMTYQAIAALTGWPLDLLKQAIGTLTQPDPDSRSPEEEGRRLVLLDPTNRQWGWRVVNHGQYREKARKQMQQIAATESGRDAERKRIERERARIGAHHPSPAMSGGVQSCPAVSSAGRLSDSDSDSDSDARGRARKRAMRLPDDFEPDLAYARDAVPDIDAQAEYERFRDFWRSKAGSAGTKLDWPATWRNWIRTCRDSGKYARRVKTASRLPPDAFEVARRGS